MKHDAINAEVTKLRANVRASLCLCSAFVSVTLSTHLYLSHPLTYHNWKRQLSSFLSEANSTQLHARSLWRPSLLPLPSAFLILFLFLLLFLFFFFFSFFFFPSLLCQSFLFEKETKLCLLACHYLLILLFSFFFFFISILQLAQTKSENKSLEADVIALRGLLELEVSLSYLRF